MLFGSLGWKVDWVIEAALFHRTQIQRFHDHWGLILVSPSEKNLGLGKLKLAQPKPFSERNFFLFRGVGKLKLFGFRGEGIFSSTFLSV